MISSPTVLVLGAGASIPYGFPSGFALREQILDIHNDRDDVRKLAELGFDVGALGAFQRRFQASHLASIDLFLKQQPEYAPLGKLCIAACIGRVEAAFSRKFLDSSAVLSDWYPMLWNAIADVPESEFLANRLSIITFNYDRSLEIFLSFAYANTYNLNPSAARFKLAQTVEIVHVYGDLGDLLTATRDSLVEGTTFGVNELRESLNSIRVIGDRVQANTKTQCGELMGAADRVCYLGFGFAPENCDAINARLNKRTVPARQLICGSAKGLLLGEQHAACARCGTQYLTGKHPFENLATFVDTDCVAALKHFGILQP